MQAGPSDPKGPLVKREKRKLACAACRARRIRCEWPPNGTGCIACALAELRRVDQLQQSELQDAEAGILFRQRIVGLKYDTPADVLVSQNPAGGTRKAEMRVQRASSAGHNQGTQTIILGGALTFHLIENLFVMANPSVPGMDYWLLRDVLHAAGGASREMEIAAECLCSAFIASSATFSDHATIVGPGNAEMPTESLTGIVENYDHFLDYGTRRFKVVSLLAERARVVFEESGMKDRPGLIVIYTLLAMDQCSTLTTDGGRKSREHILGAAQQVKHLLERETELPADQVETLKGPLGLHILLLDAQSAAVLRSPPAFTDAELSTYFPHFDFSPTSSLKLDLTKLIKPEEGWVELGKQLRPLYLSIISLYRALTSSSDMLPSDVDTPSLWQRIDFIHLQLTQADESIASLPSLDTTEATQQRQRDLTSLLVECRRNVHQIDLLLHQRIIEAALASEGAPESTVLQNYKVSRQRVQKVFSAVTELAKEATSHRSLIHVRRLFSMLDVCSTWTSLRTADRTTAAELVSELAIGEEEATILQQALALAAWSSPLAAQQRAGLRKGFGGAPTPPAAPVPPERQVKAYRRTLDSPANYKAQPYHPQLQGQALTSATHAAQQQQMPSYSPYSDPHLGGPENPQLPLSHYPQQIQSYPHPQHPHPPQFQQQQQQQYPTFPSFGVTSSFLNPPPPMIQPQTQYSAHVNDGLRYDDGTAMMPSGTGAANWDSSWSHPQHLQQPQPFQQQNGGQSWG